MKTVAIFDDDRSICTTVERLVHKMGFVCVSANTLVEAAFKIGESKPEIIIADFEFKHGLNISVLAKMLREKAKQVIILTSKDPDTIRLDHPELRFASFVRKGASMNKLRSMIS